MGHRETEHAVLEVESLNAGQPRPIRGIAELGAEQAADCLPEIVGRLGGELFFHRGIHRCGQQGVSTRELVQVVHEVAQRTARRSGLRGSAPPQRGGERRQPNTGLWTAQAAIWPSLVVPCRKGTATLRRARDARRTVAAPVPSFEEIMGEANLSAQEAQADADARVSGPDVDAGWPSGDQGATAEGPSQAERLIWRIRDRATFDALATGRRRRRGPISMTFLPGDPSVAAACCLRHRQARRPGRRPQPRAAPAAGGGAGPSRRAAAGRGLPVRRRPGGGRPPPSPRSTPRSVELLAVAGRS